MLKEWQFNVLFFVGVGGAILLLLGPELGLDVEANPAAVGGISTILTYVLTQKKTLTKSEDDNRPKHRKYPPDEREGGDGDGSS